MCIWCIHALVNRFFTYSFWTYNFCLSAWIWSWKLNITYFFKYKWFYVLFVVQWNFSSFPNELLYAVCKVFISKKLLTFFLSGFSTIFIMSITAITLSILWTTCIVSSFFEATFLWNCTQHMVLYVISKSVRCIWYWI